MNNDQQLYEQVRLLAERLERISVDSVWARRSSGHRGALLRWIERLDTAEGEIELKPDERARLNSLVEAGFTFLNRAARERLR